MTNKPYFPPLLHLVFLLSPLGNIRPYTQTPNPVERSINITRDTRKPRSQPWGGLPYLKFPNTRQRRTPFGEICNTLRPSAYLPT
ncbi:hypothetical protein K445DRAFT_318735 [Daldinia sp. EC12]|nr:hypothetical protein K445DRAFT_318735 [Daldinia sp. EC12]